MEQSSHDNGIPAGRLSGRKVLITGAASGIGQATAALFLSEGARLIVLDRNIEALASLYGQDERVCLFQADVTDEVAVQQAVEEGAARLGGIDGIVNSAGVMLRGSVMDVDLAEWRRVIEINMTAPYLIIRCCLPWLKKARLATIVNLGSGQSLLPNSPDRSAYSASKGGVLNLTRALAAELAPGIRANTVCPGLVNTPMAKGVEGNTGNYALKRLAEPEEIARAILFLTSEESSYVTGAALAVDGGRSFH